jgi:hypothetical protein
MGDPQQSPKNQSRNERREASSRTTPRTFDVPYLTFYVVPATRSTGCRR